MPASTYEPLASVTLTSVQSQVTFTSIPQTYTDLVLVINAGTTAGSGQTARIVLNGDSNANYSRTDLSGDGSSAASSNQSNLTSIVDNNVGLNASAGDYVSILNFMNYSNNTTFKTVLQRIGRANTGSFPGTFSGVYLWRNIASINSLSVSSSASTFLAGTTFNLYGVGANTLKATGGDIITTDGTYWYHAFKTSGTFRPTSGTSLTCDVLVVAGGGGGGGTASAASPGGGGGAGGIFYATTQSLSSAQTVTIGAGGAKTTAGTTVDGNPGTNTTFGSLTAAVGGGFGSGYVNGGSGGSGGGARNGGAVGATTQTGTGGTGYGSAGGSGFQFAGGGGGGSGAAGSAGQNVGSGSNGGAGGAGLNTWSTWLSTTGLGVSGYIAGGGGGGAYSATGGTGGSGGGGAGNNASGTDGTVNTGGGGGASGSNGSSNQGGAGGSGLVIVRYAV
jgi:hypothetical protein